MTRPERQYIDGERGNADEWRRGTIIEMKPRDIERINAEFSREKKKITNSAAFLTIEIRRRNFPFCTKLIFDGFDFRDTRTTTIYLRKL